MGTRVEKGKTLGKKMIRGMKISSVLQHLKLLLTSDLFMHQLRFQVSAFKSESV